MNTQLRNEIICLLPLLVLEVVGIVFVVVML
jgi:hypothetical protein